MKKVLLVGGHYDPVSSDFSSSTNLLSVKEDGVEYTGCQDFPMALAMAAGGFVGGVRLTIFIVCGVIVKEKPEKNRKNP